MFKRFGTAVAVAGVLVLFLGMTGQTVKRIEPLVPVPTPGNGQMVDETPAAWFGELQGAPLADGGNAAALKSEKAAFRAAARKAGLKFTERFEFERLWNGLSVQLERGELRKLSGIAGVRSIYPVINIAVPELPPGDETELATALAMTGADIAQSELGYTGAGVRVGIIDTGIDYHHPDLGGGFGPGHRVYTGYDFVGKFFNADPTSASYNPVPVPDLDPDDEAGHGTHVSGIVGANGVVKGVAPGVVFGAYKVFGQTGSTTADVMIAAMERALEDRMQVINMSIGASFQWPQYPTAQAADRLVNRGIVVVCSTGNNGAYGLYSAGAPGVGKNEIATASFDNSHDYLPYFTVSPDNAKVGYGLATGAPAPPTSGTIEIARTGTTASVDDACAPLPAGSLADKVALIRRGTCNFYTKAYNAMQAGAVGVVLYNNTTGRVSPTVAGTPAITIPVVAITAADGVLLDSRIAAGTTMITMTDQSDSFPAATGGLISSFSSYGLSPDLTLKPDLGAPGGSIRSTYPLELGGYAVLSGTSMSSPHVAGASALVLQARPGSSPKDVLARFQNTAVPKNWWGNPGLGYYDNVHRQGAGMIDIPDAILSTTKITPSKISAGEAATFKTFITAKNMSKQAVTYDLSYVNALSTGGVMTPAFYTSDASVAFSRSKLTILPGGSATLSATIIAPSGPSYAQFGGYIVFTPRGGGLVLRIPYAGFKGDYQGIAHMTSGGYGFPWLATLSGGSYYGQPSGATYSMVGDDMPYFLIHFEHHVRKLVMEVFDADTLRSWNTAYIEEFLPRNSTATSFFAFPWDGQTFSPLREFTVPNGNYRVRIKALKANGNPANPAHWEKWVSPVITIDRGL